MKLQKLFLAAVIVLSANAAIAQGPVSTSHIVNIQIPEIALLDLEGPGDVSDITLSGSMPADAGLPMTFEPLIATNATIWMNYTSIVKGNGAGGATSRNVFVKITGAGDVPAGLKLTVEAGIYEGTGKGTKGTKTGTIILDKTTDAVIVEGIGSVYTGNKTTNGHQLTYKLDYAGTATDYADLDFSNSGDLTITYTLTDNI